MGLLDKLEIVSEEGLLPDPKRLEGVSSWVVRLEYGEVGEAMPEVAALAKKAEDLKHVIVLVGGMDSMSSKVEGWDGLLEAGSNKFRSTLLAVGSLYDAGAEGKSYHLGWRIDGRKDQCRCECSNHVSRRCIPDFGQFAGIGVYFRQGIVHLRIFACFNGDDSPSNQSRAKKCVCGWNVGGRGGTG